MTNSEVVEQLVYVRRNLDEYLDEDRINAVNIAISVLEENDKLKAEIEQYKSALTTWNNANNEMLKFNQELKDEIEQLKSELEQSVIQCTHGYDKRQNEIGETLIFCEYTDNWMNVTLGNCLGNCEAEQHLKGQVE